MNLNRLCELSVLDLRIWVHLGYSSEEQHHAQPVSVNVLLSFPPPLGSQTDQLADTLSYAEVAPLIESLVQGRSFHLIEHLAASIYNKIHEELIDQRDRDITLQITVHKLSPPISNVHGGVSFRYSGLPQKDL